jgi:hypothetical protein
MNGSQRLLTHGTWRRLWNTVEAVWRYPVRVVHGFLNIRTHRVCNVRVVARCVFGDASNARDTATASREPVTVRCDDEAKLSRSN